MLWSAPETLGKSNAMIAKNSLSASIPASTPLQPERSASSSSSPIFDDGVGITRLVLEKQRGLEFGIDYLRIKAYFSSFDNIHRAIAVLLDQDDIYFSSKSWSPGPGAKIYPNKLEHPICSGGFIWDEDIEKIECCLDLPGQFWASLNSPQQFSKLREARFFGFHDCSRIDLRIDDFSFEVIPYQEMAKAGRQGNVFGTNTYKPFRKYKSGELVDYGNYHGSRNSSKLLRCYVHTFGDDLYHSMRMELEIKRKQAQMVYLILSEFDPTDILSFDQIVQDEFIQFAGFDRNFSNTKISNDDALLWGQLIAEIIVGAFDFRDKAVADSRRDSPRFDWWQKFIDKIGGLLRIKLKLDPPNLPKTLRWIHRQWSSTIAQLKYGLGEKFLEFIDILADFGLQKMKENHYANIDYLMRFPDLIFDFHSDYYEF